jgi:hypothetical protein
MAEPDKRPAWAWSGRFTHSVYSICFSIAISAALVLLLSRSWGHDVGEPKLEETQIWKTCYLERDCRPQQVAIVIKNHNRKQILVNIEGVETAVDKEVFKPVPSNRTWVCYINPDGPVRNENIRCILYPQQSGSV